MSSILDIDTNLVNPWIANVQYTFWPILVLDPKEDT